MSWLAISEKERLMELVFIFFAVVWLLATLLSIALRLNSRIKEKQEEATHCRQAELKDETIMKRSVNNEN
jgi:hypothetical protein